MNSLLLILILIISCNELNSQNNEIFNSNRLLYVYQFAINNYLTSDDFWAGYANTSGDYSITDSYITISNEELTDSAIFKITSGKFDVEQVFGEKLNLFKNIEFSRIHTPFKINEIVINQDEVLNKIDDPKSRILIQLSDIYEKKGMYYFILYGVSKINNEVNKNDDIVYEFEVCKDNKLIVFRSFSRFLGNSKKSSNGIKGMMYSKFDNFTCDYDNENRINRADDKEESRYRFDGIKSRKYLLEKK